MKHGVLFTALGALWCAATAQAVTVDGYVYLSGQTDHTGTLIRFLAVSPSARTDSTHSDNTGYYDLSLQPGVYDVEFSNGSYAAIELEDQVLVFDTRLATRELMPALSGYMSGTLGPGSFDVGDTLYIAADAQLWVLPGTRLCFRERVPFIVRGQLTALGTEQDSIVFTRRDLGGNGAWGGIRIDGAVDSQRFEYCILEQAGSGGFPAIWSFYALMRVTRCLVRDNVHASYGAGIVCSGGSLALSGSVFRGNFSSYGSAAVSLGNTVAEVASCVFEGNSAGIGATGQSVRIHDCVFRNNGSAYSNNARAISCFGGLIENCLAVDGDMYGPAMSCDGATTVTRCTIRGGVRCSGDAVFSSCIIAFADYHYRRGVVFENVEDARVEYSCIFGNAGGNFSGAVPAGLGIVALTNANGDSCDTYYNIFLDPQFADTAAGDYHLTGGSPCIDAGDPALPDDPDGTVADMGAFYFDQLAAGERGHRLCPYALGQNYPNPFNAGTRIAFDLARAGDVRLDVYDITGRLVRRLVDGRMDAGSHTLAFDARDLASGVYIYRLQAGNVIEARKMVVIR